MKDLRTPLNRVRGLGAAGTGTREFWIQRLTAAANVPLALFLIASIVALTSADYATVVGYVGRPMVAIPLLFLVFSGAWHMRIGMQVIFEDYIHNDAFKIFALAINNLFSAAVAISAAYALLRIGVAF